MTSRNLSVLSLALCILVSPVLAARFPDPDASLYQRVFTTFKPSITGAFICGAIYLLIGLAHSWFTLRHRSWWSWCLPIGAIASGIGLILRGVFIQQKSDSIPLYAVSQAFIVCMPALFLAYNYMLYVRLIMHNIGAEYSLFKPTIIAKMFVGIDVTTFIVQAASSALLINADTAQVGQKIFQAGVIVQSISYYSFCCFIVWTHYRVKTKQFGITGREVWWLAIWCLYFSSFLIIVRSVYRIVEASTPVGTGVHTSEGYLYGFDVVPLILCTIPYLYRWPATMIGQDRIDGNIPLNPIYHYKPQPSSSPV